MTSATLAAQLDTIPKLLARNATTFGEKPASREKEFGIWQSWNWAEVHANVEEIALGMLAIGVKAGDHIVIVGKNRPALYWSMVAAQSVGAVPVPLYQDAVAEEMAYTLDHCGAKFVIVENQEQVDKIFEIPGQTESIKKVMYLDPRGLRKYDHRNLHSFEDIRTLGKEDQRDRKSVV